MNAAAPSRCPDPAVISRFLQMYCPAGGRHSDLARWVLTWDFTKRLCRREITKVLLSNHRSVIRQQDRGNARAHGRAGPPGPAPLAPLFFGETPPYPLPRSLGRGGGGFPGADEPPPALANCR